MAKFCKYHIEECTMDSGKYYCQKCGRILKDSEIMSFNAPSPAAPTITKQSSTSSLNTDRKIPTEIKEKRKYSGLILLLASIFLSVVSAVLVEAHIISQELCTFLLFAGIVGIIAGAIINSSQKNEANPKSYTPATHSEPAPNIFTKTQYANALGRVAKGDYEGCFVWRFTDKLYVIARSGQSSYKIGYLGCEYGTLEQLANDLRKKQQCELSTNTIERIVEASSYQSGPSAAAFIDGALTAGVGYGMAKAMNSVHSSASVAVYLKDGKKMMIEFYSIENARKFQNDLFIF